MRALPVASPYHIEYLPLVFNPRQSWQHLLCLLLNTNLSGHGDKRTIDRLECSGALLWAVHLFLADSGIQLRIPGQRPAILEM